ncbi:MAG: rod shape-determining protein MreD [Alphaproteobacteria bacterium]|nr:rod shape-determining protein MreD [Alphaproteobacteria bacterium]
METFWQRLDLWARASVPTVLGLLFTFLSASLWPFPYLGNVMPPLAFFALFYWSAHRPDLFPPFVAFFIGLLNDFIGGNALGLSALLYTVAQQLILRYRSFFTGHSFFMLWVGFTLSAIIMMLVQWIVLSLLSWQLIPFLPVLIQILLAVVFFPLPCWIFIQLQRTVLSST